MIQLQPIVYVTDMHRSVDWYSRVVGSAPDDRSETWTTFSVGGATLALHHTEALGSETRLALSLVSDGALEDLLERLSVAGVAVERGIRDEPFGRSLLLRDPDGSPVQINQHG